jgi:hypothetical protein
VLPCIDSSPPLDEINFAKVLLPRSLRKHFECDPSWSRQVGGETFLYMLSPEIDSKYISDWHPRAIEEYRWEVDEGHVSALLPGLQHGYIWASLEDFLASSTLPVHGSTVSCPSWLEKYSKQEYSDTVRRAVDELFKFHYSTMNPLDAPSAPSAKLSYLSKQSISVQYHRGLFLLFS